MSSNLLSGIRDISFEIKTNSLSDLLGLKESVIASVYWMAKKNEIVLKNRLDAEKSELLKHALRNKIAILFGEKFKYYIKNYKYLGLIKGWHRFEDPLGVEDNTEIWIKRKKLVTNIIEKKPIGTHYITYEFKKNKSQNLLSKITHKSFIGLQSFLSESKVKYERINGYLLPTKIRTITTQKVTTNETNTPERTLVEEFFIYSYKVNKSNALEWFSKR
jgi:hypothetical protein